MAAVAWQLLSRLSVAVCIVYSRQAGTAKGSLCEFTRPILIRRSYWLYRCVGLSLKSNGQTDPQQYSRQAVQYYIL